MASALDGVTVLDLTRGMAGALATMFLCDNGARVIRVFEPGGPQESHPGFRVWHRGKEGVALDLARAAPGSGNAEARALDGLVRAADVLVETLAPGSPLQAAVGYARLRRLNPRLVHCSITAYGKRGPLRDEPPVDELVMARTGVLASAPGFRPGPPNVIHPLPSVGAALLAAQGIVAALLAREKTGRGRSVETSMMAGALVYANKAAGDRMPLSQFTPVTSGGGPFYSVYECGDGEYIQLACIHSGFVEVAAGVMGLWETASQPRFGGGYRPPTEEARAELMGIVAGVMKTRPASEWARILEEADVPYGRAATADEAMQDPQVRFNEMAICVNDPEVGPIAQMGLPIKLSETPGAIRGPAPVPGADTRGVVSEPARGAAAGPPGASLHGEVDPPPLAGVRVLEITNVIAGPAAGKFLADLGADVVKLEPLDGEISRPNNPRFFAYLNSNKRSLCVDTRSPEGREAAQRFVAKADVLVANLRPGATERMGLSRDALGEANPRLLETHVTGFGWSGPYSHRGGLDPLAQALSGLQRAQGGSENPPVFLAALAPTDYTAGAMAALGTVMALFVRERTGVTQRVDTNLLNAGVLLSADGFMRYEGKPPRRLADKGQHGLSALHRLYETKAGWLYLAAEEGGCWPRLCQALGWPDLASDPRFAQDAPRAEHDGALAQLLGAAFGQRPAEEWVGPLRAAGVPSAPVVEDYARGFYADPQAAANGFVVEHQHAAWGRVTYSGRLLRFSDTAPITERPTVLLGQHNREVLAEAGYTAGQVNDLYERGIVKTEEPQGG